MDDDAGRFVEHQQMLVFEQHFQWNSLALVFERLGLRHIHRDLVAWLDLLAGTNNLIIDADPPEFDQPLQSGTGHLALAVDEKDIEPLRLLTGCDEEFRNHVRHTLLKSLGEKQSARPSFASWAREDYAEGRGVIAERRT